MQAKDKLLYLESLRGIAALCVAIFHFQINSVFNNTFTDNSWLMVDFFFVLSGFVIALNYQHRIRDFQELVSFQLKRFLRLYPLHIFMLFVFLGIEIAKYLAEVKLGLIANNRAFSENNLESFVQNVFLVQNLLSDQLTWNHPSWSISAEFYTYIVFGLVTLFSFSNLLALRLMSLVIVMATGYYLFTHYSATGNGFFECVYSFFLGVLTFNLISALNLKLPDFLVPVSMLLSILAIWFVESFPKQYQVCIPFLFVFTILSLNASSNMSLIKKILSHKMLVYLGTVSYGIYMIHVFVWWVFTQILRFVFHFNTFTNEDGAVKIAMDNQIISSAVMFVGLLVVIVLAHVSYRYLEMPANRLRHKLKRA